MVRLALVNDGIFEGPETFQLTATNTSGATYAGTATVVDDGTGAFYPNNTTGNPDPAAVLDDDRPVKVNTIEVNEGSPYAVFTVTGANNQQTTLSLTEQNTDGANLATLQYFNGTAWVGYTAGDVISLDGTSLLVRVALSPEQDASIDGPESFRLVATSTGGTASAADQGVGTIVDDGTGAY